VFGGVGVVVVEFGGGEGIMVVFRELRIFYVLNCLCLFCCVCVLGVVFCQGTRVEVV